MKKLCLILLLLVPLLAGCTNSIQTMLDDYNSRFTATQPEESLSPGDEGFDEKDMLFLEYYVASDDTLNLFGPFNCSSYEWKLEDPETREEIDVVMFTNHTKYQREYVTYIPDSGLETGKTYKLTLTVTDKEGNVYTDICALVIYQHYDFD